MVGLTGGLEVAPGSKFMEEVVEVGMIGGANSYAAERGAHGLVRSKAEKVAANRRERVARK